MNRHIYKGLAVTSRDDVIDGRPPYWRYFFPNYEGNHDNNGCHRGYARQVLPSCGAIDN
jgi:hypothetical protein